MPRPRIEPTLSFPERRKDVGTSTQPSLGMFAAFGGYPASTGVPVTPFTALQSAAVYGCVNRLSQDVAKLPLGIRRRLPRGAGYVPLDTHPLNRLLRRPNGWQTPCEFWRYMMTALQIRGNAYAAIIRNRGGDPVELIPIGPDRITVQVSPRGLVFYQFTHPLIGEGVRWYADNVLHLKGMCVDGGYIGMSPIAYAQDVMGVSIAAQRQAAILFRQGNQSGGVLSTEKPLSGETATQIGNEIARHYSGVENSSKPMVLGGGFKYERMSITPDEAQFLESRRFSVEEICRIFGVPPHKVQHLEGATFSNLENQEQAYINDALQPIATSIEQEAAAKLFFDDEIAEGHEFWIDFSALLRGDAKSRFEAYSIGTQTGIYSVNEVRAKEGMAPIEGGDVHRFPLNTGVDTPKPPPTGAPGDSAPAQTEAPALSPEDT